MRRGILCLAGLIWALGLSLSPFAVEPGSESEMESEEAYRVFQENVLKAVQDKEKELDCRIALSFKDKTLSLQVEHLGEETFHAASTMKVPVMIEVFRQSEGDGLALDDPIVVDPIFHSMIDDSTFECDGREYITSRIGEEEPILKLIEQMIVVSDNLATNLLIEYCSSRKITATARALGAKTALVLRCVQDIPAYQAGVSNRLSAHDLTVLFEAIETNRAAGEASCAEMRRILLEQEYNDMIPAKLPDGVRVGHKTGAISGVRHDAGIVYAPSATYYLALLTDGLQQGNDGIETIAELSRLIYDERMKLVTPE